jgi:ribosomal-protein-alanine N-acetyltransferase
MLTFKNIERKFLKIFENELEIGTLEYTLAADEAQIIDIEIKLEYRSHGYGTKLLQEFLLNIAKNFSYAILEVRKNNLAAIGLYKKFGFTQIDLRKNYYKDPVEDALVMKKILS